MAFLGPTNFQAQSRYNTNLITELGLHQDYVQKSVEEDPSQYIYQHTQQQPTSLEQSYFPPNLHGFDLHHQQIPIQSNEGGWKVHTKKNTNLNMKKQKEEVYNPKITYMKGPTSPPSPTAALNMNFTNQQAQQSQENIYYNAEFMRAKHAQISMHMNRSNVSSMPQLQSSYSSANGNGMQHSNLRQPQFWKDFSRGYNSPTKSQKVDELEEQLFSGFSEQEKHSPELSKFPLPLAQEMYSEFMKAPVQRVSPPHQKPVNNRLIQFGLQDTADYVMNDFNSPIHLQEEPNYQYYMMQQQQQQLNQQHNELHIRQHNNQLNNQLNNNHNNQLNNHNNNNNNNNNQVTDFQNQYEQPFNDLSYADLNSVYSSNNNMQSINREMTITSPKQLINTTPPLPQEISEISKKNIITIEKQPKELKEEKKIEKNETTSTRKPGRPKKDKTKAAENTTKTDKTPETTPTKVEKKKAEDEKVADKVETLDQVIDGVRLPDLKKKLKPLGLPITGTKEKLTKKLKKFIKKNDKSEEYWINYLKAGVSSQTLTEVLYNMRVGDLKDKMKELNLNATGARSKLVDHILAHIKESGKSEDEWIDYFTTPSPEIDSQLGQTLIDKLSVVQLKKKLKDLNLNVIGNKQKLVGALVEYAEKNKEMSNGESEFWLNFFLRENEETTEVNENDEEKSVLSIPEEVKKLVYSIIDRVYQQSEKKRKTTETSNDEKSQAKHQKTDNGVIEDDGLRIITIKPTNICPILTDTPEKLKVDETSEKQKKEPRKRGRKKKDAPPKDATSTTTVSTENGEGKNATPAESSEMIYAKEKFQDSLKGLSEEEIKAFGQLLGDGLKSEFESIFTKVKSGIGKPKQILMNCPLKCRYANGIMATFPNIFTLEKHIKDTQLHKKRTKELEDLKEQGISIDGDFEQAERILSECERRRKNRKRKNEDHFVISDQMETL